MSKRGIHKNNSRTNKEESLIQKPIELDKNAIDLIYDNDDDQSDVITDLNPLIQSSDQRVHPRDAFSIPPPKPSSNGMFSPWSTINSVDSSNSNENTMYFHRMKEIDSEMAFPTGSVVGDIARSCFTKEDEIRRLLGLSSIKSSSIQKKMLSLFKILRTLVKQRKEFIVRCNNLEANLIEEHDRRINSLNENMHHQEESKIKYQNEINLLKESLRQVQEENSTLRLENMKTRKEMEEELSKMHTQHMKNTEALLNEAKLSIHQMQLFSRNSQQALNIKSQLENQIFQHKEKLATLNKQKINDDQIRISQYDRIQELEKEIKELKNDHEKEIQMSKQSLNKSLNDMNEKNLNLQRKIDHLNVEKKDLKEQMIQAHVDHNTIIELEQRKNQLQREKILWIEEKECMIQTIANLEKENRQHFQHRIHQEKDKMAFRNDLDKNEWSQFIKMKFEPLSKSILEIPLETKLLQSSKI